MIHNVARQDKKWDSNNVKLSNPEANFWETTLNAS